jgi:hypothetical protein
MNEQQQTAKLLRFIEIGLVAITLVLAVYVIVEASGWPLQARLFPWAVSIPLLVLAAVQLVRSARAAVPGDAGASESLPAMEFSILNPEARKEVLRLSAWIVAFIVLILLFSVPWGLPLAVLLYLKLESREKWPLSLLLAGLTFAYLYLLFDQSLHIPWPKGLVTELLTR